MYSPLESSFCLHDPAVGHHLDHGQRTYPSPVVDRFAGIPTRVRVRSGRDGQSAFAPVRVPDRVFPGRQRLTVLEPRHLRLRNSSDLCTRDAQVNDDHIRSPRPFVNAGIAFLFQPRQF